MPALIDPPDGSEYGFPKPAPEDARKEPFLARLADWLVENGYPEELIGLHDAPRYTRVLGRFVDEAADAEPSAEQPKGGHDDQ